MKRIFKQLTALILALSLVLGFGACVFAGPSLNKSGNSGKSLAADAEVTVEESGEYTGKEEVALYIHTYGHLPGNFITKKEANDLGWNGGPLESYAPGKSIGGGRFGNYEGLLPTKKGRQYYECDIDYDGGKRSAKRIVWSDDGLIYYTEDHYNTFERLY